jgi:hypothetical protein
VPWLCTCQSAPASTHLEVPERQEVSGPCSRAVNVAKHDGGSGAQTNTMSCTQVNTATDAHVSKSHITTPPRQDRQVVRLHQEYRL